MKALDEHFLTVVLTLLLNRVHVFCNFYVKFEQRNSKMKGLKNPRVFQEQLESQCLVMIEYLILFFCGPES